MRARACVCVCFRGEKQAESEKTERDAEREHIQTGARKPKHENPHPDSAGRDRGGLREQGSPPAARPPSGPCRGHLLGRAGKWGAWAGTPDVKWALVLGGCSSVAGTRDGKMGFRCAWGAGAWPPPSRALTPSSLSWPLLLLSGRGPGRTPKPRQQTCEALLGESHLVSRATSSAAWFCLPPHLARNRGAPAP